MRFPSPALCTTLFVLSIGLSACDSSDSDQATSVASDAPTTSTTVDPFAVPEVIDVAYVESVLSKQAELRDSVVSSVANRRDFTDADRAALSALYTGDLLTNQLQTFVRSAPQEWSEEYKRSFTAITAVEVVKSSSSCILANAQIAGPGGSTRLAYVLQPTDPTDLNPTGWVIVQNTLSEMVESSTSC